MLAATARGAGAARRAQRVRAPPQRRQPVPRGGAAGRAGVVGRAAVGGRALDERRPPHADRARQPPRVDPPPARVRSIPTARRVLGAAALLGRTLRVGAAARASPRWTGARRSTASAAAVDEQLIEVDGDGFTFRHALTREAVLHDLLPPERRDLATRAWPAARASQPRAAGPDARAGRRARRGGGRAGGRRGRHLVESARRALAQRRPRHGRGDRAPAARLAAGDEAVSFDAGEVLVHVLVAAGQAGRGARRSAATSPRASRRRPRRPPGGPTSSSSPRRPALAAGDVRGAADDAAAARAAAGDDAGRGADRPPRRRRRQRRPRPGRPRRRPSAWRAAAVDGAAATGQPAVECEALFVRRRVVRTADGIERGGAVVRAGGGGGGRRRAGPAPPPRRSRSWRSIVWTFGDRASRSTTSASTAVRYGALITVAVMDLSLADIALSGFDREACLAAAQSCVDASRRYGLATESVAHLWLAGAHALHGDHAARDAAIEAALAPDPDDPRILADLYGRVLLTSAFVDDELERLPGLLDTMIEHVRRGPADARRCTRAGSTGRCCTPSTTTTTAPAPRAEFAEAAERIGLVVYCGLRRGDGGGRPRSVGRRRGRHRPVRPRSTSRSGPTGSAPGRSTRRPARAPAPPCATAGATPCAGCARRRPSSAAAATTSSLAAAARCSARRGRRCRAEGGATSEVPTALRALGVTSREVDVLKLVAAGRSNKDIAAELVPVAQDRRAAPVEPVHPPGGGQPARPGRAGRAPTWGSADP